MSFLNPLFLFGLAAAAVPILIHLFTRKRPREMRFPSLEFLAEVNRSEIRRLRLRQWLLLLLRTLAVAALALAMSRPALRGTAGLARSASTTVVALVDESGSMGAMAPDGTLLAGARRAVESLLTTLGPADELLLVPYDQGPHAVSARPLSDVARLRAETQALEPSARATDHGPALAFAAKALAESRSLNRELFWLSDFQATGFPSAGGAPGTFTVPAGPWGEVRAYLMPLTPVSRANVGLSDAFLAPTESGVALEVTGDAYGARPGDLSVAVKDVSGDAELGRGYLSLPAEGTASTLLPLTSLPELGGAAVIPDDALALDNRRVFAAGHSGTVRVLLREEGPASPVALALAAGSPASGLAVTRVDAAGLVSRIAEADVVVLNDVPRLGPIEQQVVLDFHRGGGGLFVVLGSHAEPPSWNGALLGELGVGALGAPETAAPGAAFRLRLVAPGHPVLAGFPARPGEPLSTASFRSIPTLDLRGGPAVASGRPAARVLLEYDRGHPALVEAAHALVLTVTLDPATSDFAVSGAFLPLLHQCAKVLARGTAASSLEPGDRYSAPAGTGDWRIEDDHGQTVASEMATEAGATRIASAPLERPGLYRVLQGGTLRTTFAVNPARRESDLTPVPEASLIRAFPPGRAQVLRPGADLARRVREARYGRELWGWFVIAALVLLVAEMVVARWGMEGRMAADVPA